MYICTMAHFHIKKKNGRPYLYVREIARVNGKPKVINQIYLGSPEKVASLAKGEADVDVRLRIEEFGALWLANVMDQDIDLATMIDEIIPRQPREKGPSVGEYFLYCVLNRMVEACSKNRLVDWYKNTAIQQIRPVQIDELNSQRYWGKWDRVSENDLDKIARRFFMRVWELESPEANSLLFDTTNYYTFMDSKTDSKLSKRGNNKVGRHHLRQIGLGLLVAGESRLPLFYKAYPGNLHDSKLFAEVVDEMFGVVCGLDKTKQRLTVVIDKGMNAESNYSWIDDHDRIHFVTNYSTYFAKELATTPVEKFEPVEIERNLILQQQDQSEECLLAYRTTGEYWGKERTVVVTHNPKTARKQEYTLESKLEALRLELLEMRAKIRDQAPHWRDADAAYERYLKLCEHLRIPSDLYDVVVLKKDGGLTMKFQKNAYNIKCKQSGFGRNIIITDNMDWTTDQIVQASLDRWKVEERFRQSKDCDLVGTQPIRHWTDSKIRCHLFTCVVAMTYLRRLELKLKNKGCNRTASAVMSDMKNLHSVLTFGDGRSKPKRKIETPSKTQAEVLSALNYFVDSRGVLQSHSS